jgi:hypothetical protein
MKEILAGELIQVGLMIAGLNAAALEKASVAHDSEVACRFIDTHITQT